MSEQGDLFIVAVCPHCGRVPFANDARIRRPGGIRQWGRMVAELVDAGYDIRRLPADEVRARFGRCTCRPDEERAATGAVGAGNTEPAR